MNACTSSIVQLHTPQQAASWLHECIKGRLCTDSRELTAGDGFIAWPGTATDARQYVAQALASGAQACLVEHAGVQTYGFTDPRIATYVNLKAATGLIASAYFEQPSGQLRMLAVTGTNGKTTTTWWLAQALSRLGQRCAMVGTLGIGEPSNMVPNGLTTPNPVLLQQELRRFASEGFTACALEASSIGLVEHRLDGTAIGVAIYTNFTQDHLDYHGSMDAYWEAKKTLFSWPGLKAAVINQDDDKGQELIEALGESQIDLWTLSYQQAARLQAKNLRQGAQGLDFDVYEGTEHHAVSTLSVGHYNVTNLLGVIATLRALGIPLAQATQACVDLQPAPGRMQTIVQAGQPLVVIDYAHTPDALGKVLLALTDVAAQRAGKLWCVFGCGGDRDSAKRPLMAAVAEAHADYVLVTSDNPRSEKPSAIISQILLGLSHRNSVQVQTDRALAIADALAQASAQDVVLIAGKGHETTQEIAGHKFAFSDLEHAQGALELRSASAKK